MSFNDEVNAVKSATVEEETRRDELEEPARIRFEAEVRDLWMATEEYWRSNAKLVDSAHALYIATGRWEGRGEMVTPQFPQVKVFTRSRSRSEWKSGTQVPDESIDGLRLNDWFALCAPGVIRELRIAPDLLHYDVRRLLTMSNADRAEIHERHMQAYQQSYHQAPWSDVRTSMGGPDETTFGMAFTGPTGKPDVALRCSGKSPIEVYVASTDGWDRLCGLRELVVRAVAELPL